MTTRDLGRRDPAVYCARSTDVRKPDQIAYWSKAFGALWGDVDMFETSAQGFYGALRSVQISSLRLNRLSFKGIGFRRSDHQVRSLETPFYSLAFPLRGNSIVSMDRGSVELQPTCIFLLDNSIPAQLIVPDVYETLNVQIPVPLIRERLGSACRSPTTQMAADSPEASILRIFVRSLFESGNKLDERSSSVFEQQICDLVAFCFSKVCGEQSDDGPLAPAQRERIRRCIEKLHANDRLSPSLIATSCGISVSYLHKLYRDTGRTVMEHVREVRLDAGHELLQRRNARRTSVSEIAYAVGFKSLSEFSRAYKRRFGWPPVRMGN